MQAQETTFERHYSVDELAALGRVSDDRVCRRFLPTEHRGIFGHPG